MLLIGPLGAPKSASMHVCATHVRGKREVWVEDKKRNVVSAMAGFPTEGDWRCGPAGYVNEARVFVCLGANISFTCGEKKNKPKIAVLLHLLAMCGACLSSHINNMCRL